jgi:hypothetical protein
MQTVKCIDLIKFGTCQEFANLSTFNFYWEGKKKGNDIKIFIVEKQIN